MPGPSILAGGLGHAGHLAVLDGERDLLALSAYAGVRARLRVEDNNGILVELATMLGVDPFLSATWTESIDLSCALGTITLNSLAGDTNLSPLMDGSLANVAGPLLGVRRKFELSTAIGESGGWQQILVGIIDRAGSWRSGRVRSSRRSRLRSCPPTPTAMMPSFWLAIPSSGFSRSRSPSNDSMGYWAHWSARRRVSAADAIRPYPVTDVTRIRTS